MTVGLLVYLNIVISVKKKKLYWPENVFVKISQIRPMSCEMP